MGIYARLINLDERFANIKGHDPVIVNHLNNRTTDEKENINSTVYTTIGDVYNNIPSCQCGKKKGKFRLGEICGNCGEPVKEIIEEYLENRVWIKQPVGVAPLINPQVWLMLRERFSLGNKKPAFEVIQYMTDTGYREPPMHKGTKKVNEFIAEFNTWRRGPRNYNTFVENFDYYMECLFNSNVLKKKDVGNNLKDLIDANRDKIFCSYVPVPNKSLLVIEESPYGKYIDKSLTAAIDAIRLLTGIDEDEEANRNTGIKQNRVSKALTNLSEYYKQTYKELMSPKEGIFRKHVFGTRVDYSFRTVISSLTGPHRYDEIHVPWAVAINVLYNHIASKLMHKGYSPNEIFTFINQYNLEYHPEMEKILKELIKEAGPRGIPCLVNRNPSLGRGSIQRVYITKVKTNTRDITTSISILICPAMNADFDGDAINFVLLLDRNAEFKARKLAPETNIFDLNSIHEASDVVQLPKPVAGTIANWLGGDKEVDPNIRKRMNQYSV